MTEPTNNPYIPQTAQPGPERAVDLGDGAGPAEYTGTDTASVREAAERGRRLLSARLASGVWPSVAMVDAISERVDEVIEHQQLTATMNDPSAADLRDRSMREEALHIVEQFEAFPFDERRISRIPLVDRVHEMLRAEGLPSVREAQREGFREEVRDLIQSRGQSSATSSAEQAESPRTEELTAVAASEDDLTDEEALLRNASYYEARWVEETAQTYANLRHGHTDEVTQLLHEVDENLRNFDRGGYPPDSDEMDGIYVDAVTRAAIPYGQQPVSVEEVARQLRNVGYDVPTIDLDTIGQRTGVTPLQRDFVTSAIDGDFQAVWDQHVGNDYSLPVSRSAIHDYGFGPSLAVSIGEVGQGETVVHVSLDSDGSVTLEDDATTSLDVAELSHSSGLSPDEVKTLTSGAAAALRTTVEPDPALVDLASARLDVRRAIASITEDSETAQSHLLAANKTLTQVVETLRPDAKPDVQAAQESVQQASERVEAVTETAKKVDTEVTVYTTDGCPGCFATKRALDKAGVEYEEVNLQEHPELVDQFKRQLGRDGQKVTAPFVTTKDGDLWAGYNPEKLKEHGLDHRTRQQRQGGAGTDQGHGR